MHGRFQQKYVDRFQHDAILHICQENDKNIYRTHSQGIMKKIIAITGMMVGSYLGWWLGEKVGLVTAFMLSTIGAGVGLYAARRWAKNLSE